MPRGTSRKLGSTVSHVGGVEGNTELCLGRRDVGLTQVLSLGKLSESSKTIRL